jgi:hypothetical protein
LLFTLTNVNNNLWMHSLNVKNQVGTQHAESTSSKSKKHRRIWGNSGPRSCWYLLFGSAKLGRSQVVGWYGRKRNRKRICSMSCMEWTQYGGGKFMWTKLRVSGHPSMKASM